MLRQHGARGRFQAVEVLAVGDDDERAPAGRQRGPAQLGQPGRPVLARQRGPDGAGGPALGQGAQQRRAGRVAGEAGRVRRPGQRVGGRRRALLRVGPARRHRQAEDVAHRPGVAVGDRAQQPGHLRGEHRLAGRHVGERQQLAGELGRPARLQDEPVDELAAEPDAHPAAGLHGVGELLRHAVVERPVQVRQGHVDDDPGHRGSAGPGSAAERVRSAQTPRPSGAPRPGRAAPTAGRGRCGRSGRRPPSGRRSAGAGPGRGRSRPGAGRTPW